MPPDVHTSVIMCLPLAASAGERQRRPARIRNSAQSRLNDSGRAIEQDAHQWSFRSMGILPTKIGFSAMAKAVAPHESFYCSADILGFLMGIGMARIRGRSPYQALWRGTRPTTLIVVSKRVRIQRNCR